MCNVMGGGGTEAQRTCQGHPDGDTWERPLLVAVVRGLSVNTVRQLLLTEIRKLMVISSTCSTHESPVMKPNSK